MTLDRKGLPPMPRYTRIASIAAMAAASMVLIAGCSAGADPATSTGGANTDGTPQRGGTVHMLQNADFSYLDPSRGFDGGVNAFYRLIYRGLTMQNAGDADDPNAIVPDLAESLGEASEDGLTWTYTLKDDIFFDDGTPITSAEVKFGISRCLGPRRSASARRTSARSSTRRPTTKARTSPATCPRSRPPTTRPSCST